MGALMDVDNYIKKKFHVKPKDNLPYVGWYNSTRNDIVDLFAELQYTKGAEIGVCKGQFSKVMLEKIPDLTLYCVDPWCAYDRLPQERATARFEIALERLKRYPRAKIIRKTSMGALEDVEDNSLDFVYIDGMHDFDHVMMDLICWSKKVKKGGIVSGHDYYMFYQSGIVQAVNAYALAHNIQNWYVTREKECSFFWVNK